MKAPGTKQSGDQRQHRGTDRLDRVSGGEVQNSGTDRLDRVSGGEAQNSGTAIGEWPDEGSGAKWLRTIAVGWGAGGGTDG